MTWAVTTTETTAVATADKQLALYESVRYNCSCVAFTPIVESKIFATEF